MVSPIDHWRETLEDLGVMGFVRVAAPRVTAPQVAARATLPPPPDRPARLVTRPDPQLPRSGSSVPAPVYHAPAGPPGRPDPQAVAACASLTDLQGTIAGCLACPLGPGRLHLVFGEGNPDADLMFIGEGPGRDEDLQGRPFVGKAGELLEKMIVSIGLKRADVYIANIVKCRPPDNRTPTPQEAAVCLGYVRKQIELVQPKVIVTLGATPLRELLGITTGITRVRGQWQRLGAGGGTPGGGTPGGGTPVMPTFHPAYVLRQYTQEVRRAVWEDLKAAKKWIDDSDNGVAPLDP